MACLQVPDVARSGGSHGQHHAVEFRIRSVDEVQDGSSAGRGVDQVVHEMTTTPKRETGSLETRPQVSDVPGLHPDRDWRIPPRRRFASPHCFTNVPCLGILHLKKPLAILLMARGQVPNLPTARKKMRRILRQRNPRYAIENQ